MRPSPKDTILPLIFLKRLSDVFEDEVRHLAHELGQERTAARLVEQDHKLVSPLMGFNIKREMVRAVNISSRTGRFSGA